MSTNPSYNTEKFKIRLNEYVSRVEEEIFKEGNTYNLPLRVVYTKKYIKIQNKLDNLNTGLYHSIIDLETLNVYFPTSKLDGTLNKRKQKPCGNIFDNDILEKIDAHTIRSICHIQD
jgi:hypothetical protein